jgi:hypothetical protein
MYYGKNPDWYPFGDRLSNPVALVPEKGNLCAILKLLNSCMLQRDAPEMTTGQIKTAINNLLKMCKSDFDVICLIKVLHNFTSTKMKMNREQIVSNQEQIAAILRELVELFNRYDSSNEFTFWKETFFKDMATAINKLMEVSDLFGSSTLKQIAIAIDKLIEVSNNTLDIQILYNLLRNALYIMTYEQIITEEQIANAIDKLVRRIAFGELRCLLESYSKPIALLQNALPIMTEGQITTEEQIATATDKLVRRIAFRGLRCLLESHLEPITAAIRNHPEKMIQFLENSFSTMDIELFEWIVGVLLRHSMVSFWTGYSDKLNPKQSSIVKEKVLVRSLKEIGYRRMQQPDISQDMRDEWMKWAVPLIPLSDV